MLLSAIPAQQGLRVKLAIRLGCSAGLWLINKLRVLFDCFSYITVEDRFGQSIAAIH
jgi:hypothetical protein